MLKRRDLSSLYVDWRTYKDLGLNFSHSSSERGIVLNKEKIGSVLGVIAILPVIISFIIFYTLRGPNADIYFNIIIFSILSIIGILIAIISLVMSKRPILFIVGLLGNGFVLVCACLLLLAMGISEP